MGRWLAGVVAGLMLAAGAAADTLVCNDGRRLNGEVTRTEKGYVVKTRGGQITIPEDQVSEWIKGSTAVPTPPTPATSPQTPSVAGPTSRPALAPKDPKRLEAIEKCLKQGQDALTAGEYSAAQARFLDVLEIDPNNPSAHHGLALAHIGLGQLAKAVTSIEKAMELSKGRPPRPLVINFAVIQVANRNAMRAVKYLMEHFKDRANETDETAVNALAIALANSDESAKSGMLFNNAAKVYMDLNAKLEAGRTAQKRWGVAWVSPAEFIRLDAEWRRTQAILDRKGEALYDASRRLEDANRQYSKAKRDAILGLGTAMQIRRAETAVGDARDAYDRALKDFNDYLPQVTRPKFPPAIAAVPMDELTAPEKIDAFASAPPPVASPVRRVARPSALPRPEPPAPKPADSAAQPAPPVPVPPPPTIFVRRESGRSSLRWATAIPVSPDLLLTAASAVKGATEIRIASVDSRGYIGQVVRVDEASGLALVRAGGAKMAFVRLAESYRSGPVQCISLAPGIFELRSEAIPASIKVAPDGWTLTLLRMPRRTGAPLISNGMLVGLALADRGTEAADIDTVSLGKIRAFCGKDLPNGGAAGAPGDLICELTATVQSE